MTNAPREASIVQAVLKYLNGLPGCAAQKVHGSRFGMPTVDITGCLRGRRVELEVKVPGKDATARQKVTLGRWARAGALVGTVHSVDEVRALVEGGDG